jgi:hypothetical protein
MTLPAHFFEHRCNVHNESGYSTFQELAGSKKMWRQAKNLPHRTKNGKISLEANIKFKNE